MSEQALDQMRRVVSDLDRCNITYCVDSGTLLNLVRDGHIPPHDHDIDITVLESERSSVEDFVNKADDYTLQRRFFQDRCHKYLLLPDDDGLPKKVDIQVLQVSGEYGWLPLAEAREFYGSSVLRPVMKWFSNTRGGDYHIDRVPQSLLLRLLTLVVPLRYIYDTERRIIGGISVPIPSDVSSYLSYRYGEWEDVVKDWKLTDDGGIYDCPPEKALTVARSD